MSAISTTRHNEFMQYLEIVEPRLIASLPDSQDQAEMGEEQPEQLFGDDVLLLKQLYKNYHNQLSELKKLIAEYETVQQRIRLEIRKYQSAIRHQTPVKQKQCA